jgi:hypothetical protein
MIQRFSLRISYKVYDQHALNNQINYKIAKKQKLCEMLKGPL